MANIIDFGTKCTCAKCATRFYDLNKTPGICPKCGQKFVAVVKVYGRRPRRKVGAPQENNLLSAPAAPAGSDPKPKRKAVRWR